MFKEARSRVWNLPIFMVRKEEVRKMWLIAGLGNPEKKYNGTRHNAGFAAIDTLLDALGGKGLESTKFHGVFTKVRIGTEEVVILKPLTYMNLSGDSIAPMANFYKIPAEQVLVISDEISLSPGSIRIRKKGSAGGHNGLKSIIARLGTEDFPRIRLGVGDKDENRDLAAHVLGRFTKDEEKLMEEAYAEVAKACICTVMEGIEKAMNLYNKKCNTI